MLCTAFACLPVVADTATSLSSLDGTVPSKGATYSISTPEELVKFASLCTLDNNWCEGVTFVITKDIDLNPGWTASSTAPEGQNAILWTSVLSFKGVLDGGNHTVSGFYVANGRDYKAELLGSGNEIASGIFCSMSGTTATIRNINIENSYIHSEKIVGSIIGITTTGVDNRGLTVSNVTSSAIVESDTAYAGGIIGVVNGTGPINVTDCTFKGTVKGTTNVGGIIACTWRPVIVTDCVNEGNVIATADKNVQMGGIIGYYTGGDSNLTMERCVNKGNIYTENCHNNAVIGGIVGFSAYAITVKDCVNVGNVELRRSETIKSTLGANSKLGGIIGAVNQKAGGKTLSLDGCASLGTVMFHPSSDVTQNEAGNYVGGLIGMSLVDWRTSSSGTYVYNDGPAVNLTDCVVAGTVGGGKARIGGLMGNCTNATGNFVRCAFVGDYDGGNYWLAGGILGDVHYAGTNTSNKLTFTDCYFASQTYYNYQGGGSIALRAFGSYSSANTCKRYVDVIVTGDDIVYSVKAEQLTGEIQANFNALNAPFLLAQGGKAGDSLLGNNAKETLSAYDFTAKWTVFADIPMPASVAVLLEEADVPDIGKDEDSNAGGNQSGSQDQNQGGDNQTPDGGDENNNNGGTKLPDTFDPSLIIGDTKKDKQETESVTETEATTTEPEAETTVDADDGGCSSSLGFGALTVTVLLICIAILLKKRRVATEE